MRTAVSMTSRHTSWDGCSLDRVAHHAVGVSRGRRLGELVGETAEEVDVAAQHGRVDRAVGQRPVDRDPASRTGRSPGRRVERPSPPASRAVGEHADRGAPAPAAEDAQLVPRMRDDRSTGSVHRAGTSWPGTASEWTWVGLLEIGRMRSASTGRSREIRGLETPRHLTGDDPGGVRRRLSPAIVIRVLVIVSWLGLGHPMKTPAAGFLPRAHLRLVEALARSGRSELLLCATCSSVATRVPRVPADEGTTLRQLRSSAPRAPLVGSIRRRGGGRPGGSRRDSSRTASFLQAVRQYGRYVDQHVHRRCRTRRRGSTCPLAGSRFLHARGAAGPSRRIVTIYVAHVRYAHRETTAAPVDGSGIRQVSARTTVITASRPRARSSTSWGWPRPSASFVTPLAADPALFHVRAPDRMEAVRTRCEFPAGPYLLRSTSSTSGRTSTRAVRAFTRMVRQTGRARPDVRAGRRARPRHGATGGRRSAEAHAAGARVVSTGTCAMRIWPRCTAARWPSCSRHSTGFGLPLLEAMQCSGRTGHQLEHVVPLPESSRHRRH